MLQATGLRIERVGNLASNGARVVNPLVHKRGGWKVVAAATKVKPRIMRLRKDEIGQVLPWTGSGEQRLQKLGTPATWLTRLAISLAGSAMFYNYNTMAAAMASLYWAWDPLLSTTFANTSLRLQYPYAGLWRARVLSAKVVKPVQRPRSDDVFQEIFESQSSIRKPFLKLVIGDGSSATLEMKVGLPNKKKLVQVGEAVEVLVLSDIKSLSRFMAVRDVYLPEMGIWLSEEPCIERPVFEELIETLRVGSSTSPTTPALKGRDTQSVKARLPDSVDMIPESSLDQRDFAPEQQTARRWRLTQLDYEEFESPVDEDPKLQALRRLSQTQRNGESQRRAQADVPGPPRQYMRMQDYSSDSEDFWEQDNSNMVRASGQSKQLEASVDDEDDAQVADDSESESDEEPKFQSPRRIGQEPKKIELQRSLQADAYGPPMQYMRMRDYGSEVEERREQDNSGMLGASGQSKEPDVFEDDAQIPDDSVKSKEAEQLTTVDEFLGSGLNEVRSRDVELVQEEEF
ncbi:hypothetical protein KC19_1G326200 [Ceratodon purpureus]|uniref:Uncharacterized protein n=1 Tax=Ceratodon purpureus TaxID=3225 RepID=A0A8T0JBU9_CERPU|nr:hypothetical protein KC19_1G326200 [Ceratodon purpureus]